MARWCRFGGFGATPLDLPTTCCVAPGAHRRRCWRYPRVMVRARLNIVVSGGTGSGQDNAAERALGIHRRWYRRTHCHHRRLGGTCRSSRVTWRGWSAGLPNSLRVCQARFRQRELVIQPRCVICVPTAFILGEACVAKRRLDMLQAMNTGHDGSINDDSRQQSRAMRSPASRRWR